MSSKGLTTAEALERAKKGKNVLTQGKKKSLFSVIAEQFASPLLLLLVAASVISIMTGEIVDGIIIIVVVLANVIIGTVQELSAEKSVEALRQINASTAVVIRDGVETEIPASELVVDDYVILEAGRVVPADLALVQTSSLKVNESALTGESVAVEKDCSETSDEKTPLGDRKDKAFMSTLVEYGRGEGVVLYEEGLDSEVVHNAVRAIREADTLIIGGTSLVVYPAAGLIDYFRGRHLVLINKTETKADARAELVIRDAIGKVLSAAVEGI